MTRFKKDPLEGLDPRTSIEDAWVCLLQWDRYLKLQVSTRCTHLDAANEIEDVEQFARELAIVQIQRWDPAKLSSLSGWTRTAIWYCVGVAIPRVQPNGSRRSGLIASCCQRAWNELVEELERSPTYEEVALLASEYGRSFASSISPQLVKRWATGSNPHDPVNLNGTGSNTAGEGHTWEEMLSDRSAEDVEDEAIKGIHLQMVLKIISEIPEPRDREIMRLHHVEGKTYGEISRIISESEYVDLSASGVKQLDHRYREILRDIVRCGGLRDASEWLEPEPERLPRPGSDELEGDGGDTSGLDDLSIDEIVSMSRDIDLDLGLTEPEQSSGGSRLPRMPTSVPENDASLLFSGF